MDINLNHTAPRVSRPLAEGNGLRPSRRQVLGGAVALAAGVPTVGAHRAAHAADPAEGATIVSNGEATSAIVLPPGVQPGAPATTIDVEAESGEITAPMRAVADDSASGGAYVDSPDDGPAFEGRVRIPVTTTNPGVYTLRARVWGIGPSADSFTVQVDDGPVWTWHLLPSYSGWRWTSITDVTDSSNRTPVSVELTAGSHVITIGARETGARIDQVRLEASDSWTQLTHSADLLADYIESSTGARIPVLTADADDPAAATSRIYLGWTGPDGDPEVEDLLTGLDSDGFVFAVRPDVVTLIGPSPWGTRYGIYHFLESQLGVAWLLPGEDGDDVPLHDTVTVTDRIEVHAPTFLSRTLPYLFDSNEPNARDWASTDPQVQWATRQRTHSRITRNGNHNLFNVFPTEVYADPSKPTYRPEIFPIGSDGEVRVPSPGSRSGWQPRFDIDLTVDIAVTYVIDFFDQHPEEPLLSLAVNDRRGYSETDLDREIINSVGQPSASRSYYSWLNDVVGRVLTQRPDLVDKIFPVLAYDAVIDPPEFDVHPNVVVMITKEAHAFGDTVYNGREHFSGMFDRWSERTETLALYDYCSGHRYLAPRLFTTTLQQAYQYGYDRGMRYSYADMVPAPIGEGPKSWVYAKMLWDLDADVNALSREWCDRVAGPAGGAKLYEFYQLWEDFWAGPAQQSPFWGLGRESIYFQFVVYDYLGYLPSESIRRAAQLMEQAAAAADTAPRRARMALLQESFSYYYAGMISYPRTVAPPATRRAAIEAVHELDSETTGRVSAAAERITIKERHDNDPVLRQRLDHYRYGQVWTGYRGSDFWNLYDYLRSEEPTGGPASVALQSVIRRGEPADPQVRMASFILRAAAGELSELAVNGDFAEGSTGAPPWRFSGTMHRADGVGMDGSAGLVVPPLPEVGIARRERSIIVPVPITPGLAAFRMRYRSEDPQPTSGSASVKIHLWTASGGNIYHYAQPMRQLADAGDAWTSLGLCEDVPATANGQQVGQLRLVGSILSLESEGNVYIDSVSLFSEHASIA